MTSLPMETTSFKPLHDMLTGQIHARLLQAGLTLKVFDVLSAGRTADEAAAEMGTHKNNTRFFLDAMTTIGLIEKKGGRYRNAPLAQHYLVSDAPVYLGPLFQLIQASSIDPLARIEEFIRNGSPRQTSEENAAIQSECAKSTRASAPWVLGEMGCRISRIVSGLPGFDSFKKMLDLGGGHGLFSLYIARASETLHAVVFDRSPAIEVAAGFIETYAMDDRVTVKAGDYTTDDIGTGYDLVWASATLYFTKNHLDVMIPKIHAALKPDGYFISFHDGLTHEQTQPDITLGWLGHLLSTGQDFRFEQGELADAMLACGFRSIRSSTLQTPFGPMDLDIARK